MNECVTEVLSAEHRRRQGLRTRCEEHENTVHAAQLWFCKYIKKKNKNTDKRRAEPDNNSQYLSMNTAALDIKAF